MKRYCLLCALFVLLFAAESFATVYYWVGASGANFNVGSNWSTSSGGSPGSTVPGSGDDAIFDGNGNNSCNISAAVAVRKLEMQGTYTATITQNGNTINVGTGNMILSGGTFSGGSANITVSGALTISGAAFTSTSGTLTITGNYTLSSGSFAANGGAVYFNGTSSRTHTGSTTFNIVEINPTANGTSVIVASGTTFTVTDLKITGTHQLHLTGDGTIDVKGDIYVSNNYHTLSHLTTITITGTGSQNIYGFTSGGGFHLPIITINKSSGTLYLHNVIYIAGDFTHTAGTIDAGTSTVVFDYVLTIAGTFALNNVNFAGGINNYIYTFTTGTELTVNGNLTLNHQTGSGYLRLTGGKIHAKGNVTASNSTNVHASSGGTTWIVIDGTGSQNLTGISSVAASRFPNIEIDKSSGTLSLVNTISAGGDWKYTQGTISAGSSTVYYINSKTITGSHGLNAVMFATGTHTIASGTTLTVNGTLTIPGSTAVTLNNGTIEAKENITVTNTSTGGGGSATILINGTSDQTLTGSGTAGQGELPKVTINKSSGTLYLVNVISVFNNWTYTAGTIDAGSSTLFLSASLTMSGSHSLNHLKQGGSVTLTIAGGTTVTVLGNFEITGNTVFSISTGTLDIKGDITVSNDAVNTAGNGTIKISGTGDQTFTGCGTAYAGRLPNIVIDKPSGTLYLSSVISLVGDWTLTNGTISAGSSTVCFNATTVTGTQTLNNIQFTGGSGSFIAAGTELTALGETKFVGASAFSLSNGVLHAKGNLTVTNTVSNPSPGSTTISIDGTGAQTFTGSGTAGGGRLPNIVVNKASGTLTLASTISVSGGWTYSAGTVDPGTSTVVFYGALNLDGQQTGSSAAMPFNNLTIGGSTITLTGNLDVNGTLTINSTTTLSAGSNTINVGAWTNNGTFTAGTSTVVFDGNSYKKISKSGGAQETFVNVTFNRSTSPGSLTLDCPVKITGACTLTKGRIKTTSTNYLEFADNATCVGGGDGAYVHGLVRKTGNDAFVFPLGDTLLPDSSAFHPLEISAPSATGDKFDAQYLAANPDPLYDTDSKDNTLESVSTCEYWTLNRVAGSSNVTARLDWNSNCATGNLASLRVASWDGSQWDDIGQSALSLNWPQGGVTSQSNVTFVSGAAKLAIAVSKPAYRGYATLKKKLDGNYYQASNSLWFKFDDEYNESSSVLIQPLNYRVIETNTNADVSLILSSRNLQSAIYGDNRFRLDLYDSNNQPLAAGYYVLEVTNEKGEKWYLRFKNN